MELPFKPAEDDIDRDWPNAENRKTWAEFWYSDEKQKAHLTLRFMSYAKQQIEEILGGVSLTTIELVYLRRAAASALEACIRFDQLGDHPKTDEGIDPQNEILHQWFAQCMDMEIPVLNRFKSAPGFWGYLHRRYAQLQDDTPLEPRTSTD